MLPAGNARQGSGGMLGMPRASSASSRSGDGFGSSPRSRRGRRSCSCARAQRWRASSQPTARSLTAMGSYMPIWSRKICSSTASESLIRGYRTEREMPDEALEWLPLFLAARGTTYLGWVHTRQDSDTARELTPLLAERACAVGEEYFAAS